MRYHISFTLYRRTTAMIRPTPRLRYGSYLHYELPAHVSRSTLQLRAVVQTVRSAVEKGDTWAGTPRLSIHSPYKSREELQAAAAAAALGTVQVYHSDPRVAQISSSLYARVEIHLFSIHPPQESSPQCKCPNAANAWPLSHLSYNTTP